MRDNESDIGPVCFGLVCGLVVGACMTAATLSMERPDCVPRHQLWDRCMQEIARYAPEKDKPQAGPNDILTAKDPEEEEDEEEEK